MCPKPKIPTPPVAPPPTPTLEQAAAYNGNLANRLTVRAEGTKAYRSGGVRLPARPATAGSRPSLGVRPATGGSTPSPQPVPSPRPTPIPPVRRGGGKSN